MIDTQEFLRWQRFFQLEPFGGAKDDWRFGMLASVLANINRGRGQKPFEPKDFMPVYQVDEAPQGKRRQTAQEQQDIFRLFAQMSELAN